MTGYVSANRFRRASLASAAQVESLCTTQPPHPQDPPSFFTAEASHVKMRGYTWSAGTLSHDMHGTTIAMQNSVTWASRLHRALMPSPSDKLSSPIVPSLPPLSPRSTPSESRREDTRRPAGSRDDGAGSRDERFFSASLVMVGRTKAPLDGTACLNSIVPIPPPNAWAKAMCNGACCQTRRFGPGGRPTRKTPPTTWPNRAQTEKSVQNILSTRNGSLSLGGALRLQLGWRSVPSGDPRQSEHGNLKHGADVRDHAGHSRTRDMHQQAARFHDQRAPATRNRPDFSAARPLPESRPLHQ